MTAYPHPVPSAFCWMVLEQWGGASSPKGRPGMCLGEGVSRCAREYGKGSENPTVAVSQCLLSTCGYRARFTRVRLQI